MRTGALGHERVSKRTWYACGGFKRTGLWRRQVRGTWHYYRSW